MIFKLDPFLLKDENYYFISLLTDRFGPLNENWAKSLEKRFHKKFKPIYILSSEHNEKYKEDNYIVINKQLYALQKKLGKKNITHLTYPEDLNKQLSKSKFAQNLIKKLIKKQGKVFVLCFSSVWLDFKENPNVVILGSDSKVSEKYDEKIEQFKLFKKLNLPVNKFTIYSSFDELRKKQKDYPFFISACFSSGGGESGAIHTKKDLQLFYRTLRPINKKSQFIASRLLTDIEHSSGSYAIVLGKNKTVLICITDQFVRGNKYVGSISPTKSSKEIQKKISDMVVKIGNYLSLQGFRGSFGADFLFTQNGDCYASDINPRRQGSYYSVVQMSKKVDIVDLELSVALNEKLPKITTQDFEIDYFWANCRVVPYSSNVRINKDFQVGNPADPFNNIGSKFVTIYYPENNILLRGSPGFYITSDFLYSNTKKNILGGLEKAISDIFSSVYK